MCDLMLLFTTSSVLFKFGEFSIALAYIFLPLILGLIHIYLRGVKTGRIDVMLTYYVIVSVGIQGAVTGLLQMFAPEMVASFTQWNYSPFLIELGMANLSFGILGLISFSLGQNGKVAAAIGYGLFLLFTGVGHMKNISLHGATPGDSGGFLFSDFIGGLAILLFAALKLIYRPKVKPVVETEP